MYRLRVIWGQSVTVRPQLHRAVRPWQLCVSREKCVFSDFLLEVSESHWVKLQRGIWCCPLAISLVPSKLPDSLQTHKSYWPSGGETMKSGARTRNRLLAFKVKAVPLKYVESVPFTLKANVLHFWFTLHFFLSFTTAWKVKGVCLQTTWHLSCKWFQW